MKILLLEDELMLQSSINEYLNDMGYIVSTFSDGLLAFEELEKDGYDLLLLDINVPSLNGLDMINKLKEQNNYTPTIFISANTDIKTISEAFDSGAIDYLKKPFHLKELAIRIQKEIENIQKIRNKHILLSKNYSLSLDENILYFNREVQQLTNKKFQIVKYLAKNIGTIITIDTLRIYIWDNEPIGDATIRAEMSRLKKELKEDFIKNIKGVGYTIERYLPKA
ncbi:MAG: response regulator transcription factor [Arcobacteraceae bacterium]|jgi:DNA-binding response OmpR family regulator|nr:response regulator transcription factor [Arcobacteraceae bacterium]